MKTAMIRKALLPVLAASAVMVSTPALAQNFTVSLSIGSPGYGQGYGYAPGYDQRYGYAPRPTRRDLQLRAQVLSQHIEQLAWDRGVHRNQARSLAAQMNQYRRAERQYAGGRLTDREYADLSNRLSRIQIQLQRVHRSRW